MSTGCRACGERHAGMSPTVVHTCRGAVQPDGAPPEPTAISTAAGPACPICGRGVGVWLSSDESPCVGHTLFDRAERGMIRALVDHAVVAARSRRPLSGIVEEVTDALMALRATPQWGTAPQAEPSVAELAFREGFFRGWHAKLEGANCELLETSYWNTSDARFNTGPR